MAILSALSLSFVVLLIIKFLISVWTQKKRSRFLPPGPAPLPLLGNPKYVDKKTGWKHYPELWKKYGPMFTIWKLTEPVVVLCGYEVVKDALVNHGEKFCARPVLPVEDLHNNGLSIASGNRMWRELRRGTLTSLRNLGMGKKSMEDRVLKETKQLLAAVSKTGGKAFNTYNVLGCAICNVRCSMLFGKCFEYDDQELLELIDNIRKHFGNFNSSFHQLCNTFPTLLYIPTIGSRLLKGSLYLESYIQKQIDLHKQALDESSPRDFINSFLIKIKENLVSLSMGEHIKTWVLNGPVAYMATNQKPSTFCYKLMDVCGLLITEQVAAIHTYIWDQEGHKSNTYLCEKGLLAIIRSILGAGTDTTRSSLKYCLVVMAHFPHIQAQVQQEIDKVTGSMRPPGIMDRPQMPYTNAVIHEIQRLLELAGTGIGHVPIEDALLQGFIIPKGTTVLPSFSSVLSDPSQWETPDEFNPGHFLDENGQFRARPAFMAFSAGKRVCLGENLARMDLFLFFSSLLQKFTFKRAPGTQPETAKSLRDNKWTHIMFSELCAIPRTSSSK